jgi:signal transduction histidine kinase/ligand-binding sensor domain-containing protein
MRFILILLILFFSVIARGQHYRFHQYRVEQGLPSDVIKAITQDSLGFFWIATDDGLVKYDGLKFTSYKNAFRSQYVKGFLHTREGNLLAFGDLDVIEIKNMVDTVQFETILTGERFLSDSAIFFPKSIFQDAEGAIWLGEPKSVVRFQDSKLKRYDFGEENRSGVFVRSFSFFEDEAKNLYTISYNGNLFKYLRDQDRFEHIKNIKLPGDINGVLFFNNRLLIAGRDGLFSVRLSDSGIKSPENIFPIRHVSHLLLDSDSSILVSTYGEDLYRIRFTPDFEWENLYHNFNGINSSYVSNEDDIWVATDKGLVLVQKNLFILSDINSQSHFVEGIAYDKQNDLIYYCSKETLVELRPTPEGEWERIVIHDEKDNYFQALQFRDGNLWASSSWKVFLFQQGKLIRTWDLSADGNFVHDIFLDSKSKLWLSQAGANELKVITEEFEIVKYPINDFKQNEINLIREGRRGFYGIASGNNTYLYFKAHDEDQFNNISVPLPFSIRGDLAVVDLSIDHNDILWLATSEGLLRFDHEKIDRVRFGEEFEEYPVSSVEIMDRDNILFSNSYGLFRFNVRTSEYWLYDENTGLPSNTITDHGIFVNENKEVWIGSSYGLAYAAGSLLESKKTRTPYCVDARVNGVITRYSSGLFAEYGSFITLRFSPISFPENKINLQWKFESDSNWHAIENQQLSLSKLKEGEYSIKVRAKKNTGYSWSDPLSMTIVIAPPYWKRTEFVFLILLVVLAIAWGSYAMSSVIMNRRKKQLEQLISERTQELQKANEELTLRNTELDRFVYSASHDLSAPLKSILGLIRVALMDKPGDIHVQYLTMMERSVNKLEAFIQEVVTYSRNTRMPVKYEVFSFKEFVESLLQDHEFSPKFQFIRFEIEDDLNGYMISDKTRMKIILNNLLSNAIKFHWIDNGRDPFIKISIKKEAQQYVLCVSDNGKGIGEAHLERIFEMFYRATDETQGSGLGLYILKESVAKLGGTVRAHSKVEEGTAFEIFLPVPEILIDK